MVLVSQEWVGAAALDYGASKDVSTSIWSDRSVFLGGSRIEGSGCQLPRLPGAVETAPGWLTETPFDVKAFFKAPPAQRNTAPLYLEALYEFGEELAVAVPSATPERSSEIKERKKRHTSNWYKDPARVPSEEIDEMLAEYAPAVAMIIQAQQRPECVFQPGITIDFQLPHAFAARNVAKVDKSGRSVDTKLDDEGQFKLLLSLISAKESSDALSNPVMAIAKLKTGYANINDPAYIRKIKTKLEAAKPDHSESRKVHDEIVGRLLASLREPYPKIVSEHEALTKAKLKGGLYDSPMVLRLMMPSYVEQIKVATRGTSLLAAAEAKVAIRRWQLTHQEKPTDLDAIMLDAGFPPTPMDPYSGKPVKLTEVDGTLIVYTIGEDGVDNGGKFDNDMGRKPLGDHLYPVPKLMEREAN